MKKKGQLYIVTAVILIGIAFAIAQAALPKKIKDNSVFNQLMDTFESESPKMINTIIENEENMTQQFSTFMETFYGYAKSRDASIEITTALFTPEDIIVYNYMDTLIEVDHGIFVSIQPKEWYRFNRVSDTVTVTTTHAAYDFEQPAQVGIKGVFRSEHQGNIRIKELQ